MKKERNHTLNRESTTNENYGEIILKTLNPKICYHLKLKKIFREWLIKK